MEKHAFSLVDMIVFIAFMLLSTGLGLLASCRRRKHHDQNNTKEYLMGGRRMPVVPTAMSLLSSLVSGIALLSIPAEVFALGTGYCWSLVGNIFALLFTAWFILPVFYKVESVNLYEFVEDRFGSRLLRTYSCVLFTLSTLVYMSVVLFAPSTALAAITDISTPALIVGLGTLATVYTSIGGLRAVVWTDAFQTVVMFAGCIILAIKGSLRVGGPATVWSTAKAGGRLQGLVNVDLNPFQYMTVWTSLFGGFFYWLSAWGSNQMSLQRFCSVSSLKKSRLLALIVIPMIALVNLLVFYYGLVMYTFYKDCDPLKAGAVTSKDQLTIYFMIEMLQDIPGFSGIFLACLFSGTLSTLSSGINSMSSVALEEFLRPFLGHYLEDERRATIASKMIGVLYGAITIGLAFAAEPLGGILSAVTAGLGALATPVLGIILLGVGVPWAEKRGALIGTVVGTALALWIFLGSVIYKPIRVFLPTDIDQCSNPLLNTSSTTIAMSLQSTTPVMFESTSMERVYSMSYFMFSIIGGATTVIVGSIASLILTNAAFAQPPTIKQRKLVYWHRNSILLDDNDIAMDEDFQFYHKEAL